MSPKRTTRGAIVPVASTPFSARRSVSTPSPSRSAARAARRPLCIATSPGDGRTKTTTSALTSAIATRPSAGRRCRRLIPSCSDHAPRAPDVGPYRGTTRGSLPGSLEVTTTGSRSSWRNVVQESSGPPLVRLPAAPPPLPAQRGSDETRPVADREAARRCRARRGSSAPRSGPGSRSGTMSQRCSIAVQPLSSDGGGRKSESTKTKLPAEDGARCSASGRAQRSRLSAGASNCASSEALLAQLAAAGAALAAAASARSPSRVVEVADEAAGARSALAITSSTRRGRRRLVEPGQRRREAAPSPAAGRRRSRRAAPPPRSARGR